MKDRATFSANRIKDCRLEPIAPQPSDPALLTRAQELEKWVSTLESRLARTGEIIFGTNAQEPKRDTVVSIEGIVADCCTRIASLCGECATINQKLSGQEEQ